MKKKKILKVVRFFSAGIISTIFGFSMLYAFTEYIGIHYLLSFVMSFIISDIFSFVIKKFWVFEEKNIKEAKLQIFLYLVLSIMYLITNTGLLLIGVEYLHIHYLIIQAVVIFLLLMPNYVLSQKIFIVQKIQQR
ncbi:MAG: GtrA family protein [Candidatus Nomurabacteria bacterium]